MSDFYCLYAETPEEIFSKWMQVILERIPRRFNLHPVNDIQVLAPMNRGGLGARSLNIELQQRLNGVSEPKVTRYGSVYAPRDKVIQQVNNYDKEVFNGDIGVVLAVDVEESLAQIQFNDRIVDYNITGSDLTFDIPAFSFPPSSQPDSR